MQKVISTRPSRIPGANLLRRSWLVWRLGHVELDQKAHEENAKLARLEAQRLRCELALLETT